MEDQTAGLTNLAKLLPTTTVLTYQTLNPLITKNGHCHQPYTIFPIVFISICTIACALASITDTVVRNGKLYYGIAWFNKFCVFNNRNDYAKVEARFRNQCTTRYKLRISDLIHVVLTVVVFLSLSFSDGYVQSCFGVGSDVKQWLSILPLGMGVVASLVFLLFPLTRNGIGYLTESETMFPPENQAVPQGNGSPQGNGAPQGNGTPGKILEWLSNLVKLLPTTTVLTFQTLNPSFTNRGQCFLSNIILTAVLIFTCSVACVLASITDTVLYGGKLYYGIALHKGFKIFNIDENGRDNDDQKVKLLRKHCTQTYKLKFTDFFHVGLPLLIFLLLSFSDEYVMSCFFAGVGSLVKWLLRFVLLGIGAVACVVVVYYPGIRKGIGYSTQYTTTATTATT